MSTPLRWKVQTWIGRERPSDAAPVVIGGCGSSGTTLLRHRLNRHPQIFCGPESTLFLARTTSSADLANRFGFDADAVRGWRAASASKTEFIEAFQSACLAASGKRVWAEKTPENVRRFVQIARQFPKARFVHLVRDGRDVACSLRQARWMKLEKIIGRADRASPEALEACGRYWAERVRFGRSLAGRPNYHEVRYEDLVADPEAALRPLLAFLGVEWDDRVLQDDAQGAARAEGPMFETSIGRWRAELSRAEAALLERCLGPELVELGYEAGPAWTGAARGAPVRRPAPERLAPSWKALRRDAYALWLGLRDPRFPWLSRIVGLAGALYLVAPFDLIPDRIPVFGLLDDVFAALLTLGLMFRLIPDNLRRELRHAASLRLSRRTWAA